MITSFHTLVVLSVEDVMTLLPAGMRTRPERPLLGWKGDTSIPVALRRPLTDAKRKVGWLLRRLRAKSGSESGPTPHWSRRRQRHPF